MRTYAHMRVRVHAYVCMFLCLANFTNSAMRTRVVCQRAHIRVAENDIVSLGIILLRTGNHFLHSTAFGLHAIGQNPVMHERIR